MDDQYLTTAQTKARYNVHEDTLDRWSADPKVAFPKPEIIRGRKYRLLSDLVAWDEARRQQNGEAA